MEPTKGMVCMLSLLRKEMRSELGWYKKAESETIARSDSELGYF